MKKLIALVLIFSLLALSGNLMAKERRGAEIIVQKKDGQRIRGELIAIKEKSLLLLVSGVDVSVDISDVSVITIVKKSKVFMGILGGLLFGGGVGALIGLSAGDDERGPPTWKPFATAEQKAAIAGAGFAIIGALIGGIGGAVAGIDETYKIEGKSPEKVKKALEKLRKKARIPDYK